MATPEPMDGRRARRGDVVLTGAAIIAILALLVHEVMLARRIAALEAAVAQRDAADPLMPLECRGSFPTRGELAGGSRDKPCIVTFQRLLDAPQQFNGRWVEVQGRYSSGMERSALYPVDSTPAAMAAWESDEHALWVDVAPFAPADSENRAVFVGRFRRGPAGHLGAYFAALEDR